MEWPEVFFKRFFYIYPSILFIFNRVACFLIHESFTHLEKVQSHFMSFFFSDLARPFKSHSISPPETSQKVTAREMYWSGAVFLSPLSAAWACSSKCTE